MLLQSLLHEEHNFPTDHHIIEFRVKLRFKRAKPITRTTYNYEHGNSNDLRSLLLREPLDIDLSDDIDVFWSKWKNLFSKAVAKFIPVKTNKDTNSPPWIEGGVRHLIRKKYACCSEKISRIENR